MSLAAHTMRDYPTVVTPEPQVSPVTMQQVSTQGWDAAIAGFSGLCQEQLHAFASARWPGVVEEPQLFFDGDRVVGGCLVMVQPLPLRLGAIAVAKWAPMLAEPGPEAGPLYKAMIEALIAEYDVKRGLLLSILPRASLGAGNVEFDYLLARGFRRGASLLFPDRYIVNLRLSDAEQRRSFHQKWRYHLNKADKQGLAFEHAEPHRWGEFAALYEQMVDRKRFPDHSAFETVGPLMSMTADAARPELFLVKKEGRIVAGAIIFKAGERAVYLYGATSDDALELRAGYFLHWQVIRWLRDNTKADWYDLGGTDGFQGLHQFKKGMVGERGIITPVPPVANYSSRLWPRLIGETAFAAREVLHAANRQIDRLRPDRAKPDQGRPGADA